MTVQSFFLLHRLKHVQGSPNNWVMADTSHCILKTANVSADQQKSTKLSEPFWSRHLARSLEELTADGYLTLMSADLSDHYFYQITASGQYLGQHILGRILRFLSASILTPIIVSLLTTYITLKVFGQI